MLLVLAVFVSTAAIAQTDTTTREGHIQSGAPPTDPAEKDSKPAEKSIRSSGNASAGDKMNSTRNADGTISPQKTTLNKDSIGVRKSQPAARDSNNRMDMERDSLR